MGKSGRSDGPFAPGRRPVAARGRRAGRGCAEKGKSAQLRHALLYCIAEKGVNPDISLAAGRKGACFRRGRALFSAGFGGGYSGGGGRGRSERLGGGGQRRLKSFESGGGHVLGADSYDLSTIRFDSTGGRDLGRAGRTREALMATSFGGPAGGPGWGAAGRAGAGQWGLSSKRQEKLYR